VTLQKSSRGLGLSVSGGGTAGPIRVKRLFPQQPAALSNKLQIGDILLAANGRPLTGLTSYVSNQLIRLRINNRWKRNSESNYKLINEINNLQTTYNDIS